MPASKKYTEFIFEDIENPGLLDLHGDTGIMFQFLWQLTKARHEKCLSQQELSEKSGIPRPSIARIEAGRSNPSLLQIVRILRAMRLDLQIIKSSRDWDENIDQD